MLAIQNTASRINVPNPPHRLRLTCPSSTWTTLQTPLPLCWLPLNGPSSVQSSKNTPGKQHAHAHVYPWSSRNPVLLIFILPGPASSWFAVGRLLNLCASCTVHLLYVKIAVCFILWFYHVTWHLLSLCLFSTKCNKFQGWRGFPVHSSELHLLSELHSALDQNLIIIPAFETIVLKSYLIRLFHSSPNNPCEFHSRVKSYINTKSQSSGLSFWAHF